MIEKKATPTEAITPKSDEAKRKAVVQKMIDWIKGNPDSEIAKLVERTLARLARQKREDGEV